MRKLFKNALLVFSPGEVSGHGFLSVQDGIIERVERRVESPAWEQSLRQAESLCDEVIDCAGDYLAPGLIDLHCHGALGRDTMEATPEAFGEILAFHATRGTTLAVLTTVAASLHEMLAVFKAAEDYKKRECHTGFAGIHLEGPYFSPYRLGAHRAEMLRCPTPAETLVLLHHAGVISRVTLAPELPGAIELTGELIRHGIAVSAGHSAATEVEAKAGFEAGITQATHLYNCMSSLHSNGGRRFAGLAEASLTTTGILCEVIADGHHLPPALLRLVWLAKSWESTVIVSDATAGAGMPEGSHFDLGNLHCRIKDGLACIGEGEEQRLAGSTIGMIDGVRVMVEKAHIPLEEAVAMASLVPARALKISHTTGSLKKGKRGDLVRFSRSWEVRGVWAGGLRIDEGNIFAI